MSAIPGTTRDTIEETLTIDGITFRIIDTAGLRSTDDEVETLGIERSRKAVEEATLVLYLHDSTQPWLEPEIELDGKKAIIILTKTDLPHPTPPTTHLAISAKTGEGLDELKSAMVASARGDIRDSDTLVSNPRHYEALLRVQQALQRVEQGLEGGTPTDLVAIDLRDALYHLGTITGEVTNNEILGNIFSRFCVGK